MPAAGEIHDPEISGVGIFQDSAITGYQACSGKPRGGDDESIRGIGMKRTGQKTGFYCHPFIHRQCMDDEFFTRAPQPRPGVPGHSDATRLMQHQSLP